MDHLTDIKRLIKILATSSKFHLLVIKGPPGWGKTQLVTSALAELGLSHQSVGTFATPLALFNQFSKFPDGIHLLDDTALLLSNQQLVSLLCSATWPTSSNGQRLVRRTSTSERANVEEFEFRGKAIVITNKLSKSHFAEALLSRALHFSFSIDAAAIPAALMGAARNREYFADVEIAGNIAQYLMNQLDKLDTEQINLRTLQLGYDLAVECGAGWEEIFSKIIPWKASAQVGSKDLLKRLINGGGPVEAQIAAYMRETGKSRRSFFNAKRQIVGLEIG